MQTKNVIKRKLTECKLHEVSMLIYCYTAEQVRELAASMKEVGQKEPIIMNADGYIISGALRYKAAVLLEWEFIDAIINETSNADAVNVLHHNKSRKKTNREIKKLVEYLAEIIHKSQGKRNDLIPDGLKGKRTEIIATIVGGISASNVDTLLKVIETEKADEEYKKLGLTDLLLDGKFTYDKAKKRTAQYFENKKAKKEALNKPIIEMPRIESFKIYNKSCIDMCELATESVQVIFTSPPYWKRQPYDNPNELGQEPLREDFIINLLAYFGNECRRVLKVKGSLFVNIGETILHGVFQEIPEMFLAGMTKMGWFCVGKITWVKPMLPNTKGAGGKIRRLQNTCEMIYHFVKNSPEEVIYDYAPYKIWNDDDQTFIPRPGGRNLDGTKTTGGFILKPNCTKFKNYIEAQDVENVFKGSNAGSRQVALKKINSDTDHPALMPSYLPVIPILECSNDGDIILDLFSGSGTVGITAHMLGRYYVGYELKTEFATLSLEDFSRYYVSENNTIELIAHLEVEAGFDAVYAVSNDVDIEDEDNADFFKDF